MEAWKQDLLARHSNSAPGLHPSNSALFDAITRHMMQDDSTWPCAVLMLKRRGRDFVCGEISAPISGAGPVRIQLSSIDGGRVETFASIDDALRAGWTVD